MSTLPLPPAPLDSPTSLTDSSDSFSSFDYECVALNHNEMTVLRSPKDSKFPVYMITSPHDDKNYILKLFPYEENQMSCYYQREARFNQLSHENIIEISHIENFAQFYYSNREFKVSYIMSEYAQNGDFYQAVNTHKLALDIDEKLLRTYFHQMIEGLEYLHVQGVSHLDIKPENLMLADDYTLKIIDFDLSYYHGDDSVTTKGTKNYRAPELFNQTCEYPELADVYSAAITLFFLKTKGSLPYMEDQLIDGIDMVVLKQDNPTRFWKVHEQREHRPADFFSTDFKELFMSMVNINPAERATIHEIKNSQWYNGEVYNKEELKRLMKAKLRN